MLFYDDAIEFNFKCALVYENRLIVKVITIVVIVNVGIVRMAMGQIGLILHSLMSRVANAR